MNNSLKTKEPSSDQNCLGGLMVTVDRGLIMGCSDKVIHGPIPLVPLSVVSFGQCRNGSVQVFFH